MAHPLLKIKQSEGCFIAFDRTTEGTRRRVCGTVEQNLRGAPICLGEIFECGHEDKDGSPLKCTKF
jgi:hypothetical protein